MSKSASGTLSLRLYYLMACGIGGVYLPFFPRWLEGRGMVGVRLGIVAAAAPAMGVLAPTAFGALADALRLRGGLLQLACAGAFVSLGALAVAAHVGLPLGFGVLFSAALLFALFRAPMGFIADVVAIELAPAAGTTYGRLRLWGSLGFIIAVPVAAKFVDPTDAQAFPAVTSCFVLGAFLASLYLPRRAHLPDRGVRRGALHLLGEPDFSLFLVAVFLGQCGQVAYDLCFSLRLFDLGIPRTALTFTLAWDIGTGAEVLMMAYCAPLFRSFSPPALFAFALGCASLRWAAIAVVRSHALLLALQPLHALSWALAWLASVAYTSRRFPSHSLGTAQGLLMTAVGAGSVVGMVIWGSVYHRVGSAIVFAGASGFAATGFACAVALDLRSRTPSRSAPG
jgi:MFS transporter, PPP family, 3-phenylpropionic acid transporter